MALSPNEVLNLTDEVRELGASILEARQAESTGGKKITKDEARKIAIKAAKLALKLIINILD